MASGAVTADDDATAEEKETIGRLPRAAAGLGNCLAVRPRSNWVALLASPAQLLLLALQSPPPDDRPDPEPTGALLLQRLTFRASSWPTSLSWSADGALLAVAFHSHVALYQVGNGGLCWIAEQRLPFHVKAIALATASEDGCYMLACGGAGGVCVYGVTAKTGTPTCQPSVVVELTERPLHESYPMMSLCFCPEGRTLAAVSLTGQLGVSVWSSDLRQWVLGFHDEVPCDRVTSMAFSPDCSLLAVMGWGGHTMLYKRVPLDGTHDAAVAMERLTLLQVGELRCPSPDTAGASFIDFLDSPTACTCCHRHVPSSSRCSGIFPAAAELAVCVIGKTVVHCSVDSDNSVAIVSSTPETAAAAAAVSVGSVATRTRIVAAKAEVDMHSSGGPDLIKGFGVMKLRGPPLIVTYSSCGQLELLSASRDSYPGVVVGKPVDQKQTTALHSLAGRVEPLPPVGCTCKEGKGAASAQLVCSWADPYPAAAHVAGPIIGVPCHNGGGEVGWVHLQRQAAAAAAQLLQRHLSGGCPSFETVLVDLPSIHRPSLSPQPRCLSAQGSPWPREEELGWGGEVERLAIGPAHLLLLRPEALLLLERGQALREWMALVGGEGGAVVADAGVGHVAALGRSGTVTIWETTRVGGEVVAVVPLPNFQHVVCQCEEWRVSLHFCHPPRAGEAVHRDASLAVSLHRRVWDSPPDASCSDFHVWTVHRPCGGTAATWRVECGRYRVSMEGVGGGRGVVGMRRGMEVSVCGLVGELLLLRIAMGDGAGGDEVMGSDGDDSRWAALRLGLNVDHNVVAST